MNTVTSTAHQSERGYWQATMYLNGAVTETTCSHCHHTEAAATKCSRTWVSEWQHRFDTATATATVAGGYTEVAFIDKRGRTCTFRYRIVEANQ